MTSLYFDPAPGVDFDGAVDAAHPDTLFLSSDPSRNAQQVAMHELTHALENTTAPDGTSLADILHQQVRENLTPAGQALGLRLFGATAPKRAEFGPGEAGDEAHEQAVTTHIIKEVATDIGGEALKFDTFLPKVIDAARARYGDPAADSMLQKFMEGIRSAIDAVREFFGKSPHFLPAHRHQS